MRLKGAVFGVIAGLLILVAVVPAGAAQVKSLDNTRWSISVSDVRVVCTTPNPRYQGGMGYINFIAQNEPYRWVNNGVTFLPQARRADPLKYMVSNYKLRGGKVEFEGVPDFYGRFVESTYVTKFYGQLEGQKITGNFEIVPKSAQGLPPLCANVIIVGKFEMQYLGTVAPIGGVSGTAGSPESQAAAAGAVGGLTGLLSWLLARAQGGSLAGNMINDKGQVWFQAPWEQGGPMWIDRTEYDQIMGRFSQGLVWSDSFGWVAPNQLSYNERVRAANWARAVQGQGNMMDLVRAQRALEDLGRVDPIDRALLKIWVDRHSPLNMEINQGMHRLLDELIIETQGGLIGDVDAIRQALGQELQRVNQPELTYWEHYALRELEMEKGGISPAALMMMDGAGTGETVYDLWKNKEKGDPLWNALKEFKQTRSLDKFRRELTNPDWSPSKLELVGKTLQALDYYSRYSQVMDGTEAAARTTVQVGVQWFATKNPIIGLTDTVLSYGTNLLLDQEISVSKGLEVLVNVGFDSVTDPFAGGPAALDFNDPGLRTQIQQKQVLALEQRLQSGTLSPAERDQVLALHKQLRGDGN